MKKISLFLILIISGATFGQQTITLEECQQLISVNYPLLKQSETLIKQNQLDTEIINNGKLPQFSLDGQLTYQSDVIKVPMPGATSLNKEQYKTTLSVNQLIFNGGLIEANNQLKSAQLKTKQQQLKVQVYQLKKQVNQLYFSVLMAQEAILLVEAKNKLIQSKLKEVTSGIKNGVLVASSEKILKVELLKNKQQLEEIISNKKVLIATLSKLITITIDEDAVFKKPIIEVALNTEINRPELDLFQLKKEEIESSINLVSKKNAPTIMSFATGGFGNPGLNMLDNSFQSYYIVGAKLQWTLFDWSSNKKQQKSLELNKEIIDNEQDVFLLNTQIDLHQQEKEIEKINGFILSDTEIIKLRNEVLETADSQLKNGTITVSEYITELTNLFVDKNKLVTHQIQLQLVKANYTITKGQ
ncbi:TolC family protein [Polaribacter uvawellassae]|uniref:TolC family protein n=1 Tax=Polaribacter uvawellassae TaxID=3133495 RepID=UPI00321947F6